MVWSQRRPTPTIQKDKPPLYNFCIEKILPSHIVIFAQRKWQIIPLCNFCTKKIINYPTTQLNVWIGHHNWYKRTKLRQSIFRCLFLNYFNLFNLGLRNLTPNGILRKILIQWNLRNIILINILIFSIS